MEVDPRNGKVKAFQEAKYRSFKLDPSPMIAGKYVETGKFSVTPTTDGDDPPLLMIGLVGEITSPCKAINKEGISTHSSRNLISLKSS